MLGFIKKLSPHNSVNLENLTFSEGCELQKVMNRSFLRFARSYTGQRVGPRVTLPTIFISTKIDPDRRHQNRNLRTLRYQLRLAAPGLPPPAWPAQCFWLVLFLAVELLLFCNHMLGRHYGNG